MTTGECRLRVEGVGPSVSFQDGGRQGHMRFGVPASGPMDRLAHKAANIAIGNDPAATAIEISLGGLTVECLGEPVTMSLAGGGFVVDHAGSRGEGWRVFTLRRGEHVTIRAGSWGSWSYLAVAGVMDVSTWLSSAATHSQSGFGGGTLSAGQEIAVSEARVETERDGEIATPDIARPSTNVRVVLGPQDQYFDDQALAAFANEPFTLTQAYDRMGVRLDGPPLGLGEALGIPSEPIIRGSIQVAGDGVPTVLLADHQTTGGYPKIATMITADVDRFTQNRAGDSVRFEPIEPEDALTETRRHALEADGFLSYASKPGRTLAQRLGNRNLDSWGAFLDD